MRITLKASMKNKMQNKIHLNHLRIAIRLFAHLLPTKLDPLNRNNRMEIKLYSLIKMKLLRNSVNQINLETAKNQITIYLPHIIPQLNHQHLKINQINCNSLCNLKIWLIHLILNIIL